MSKLYRFLLPPELAPPGAGLALRVGTSWAPGGSSPRSCTHP